MAKSYFPKVAEAREALKAKALELYELHMKTIEAALAAGEYEAALKAQQWLIEHMPKEAGVAMIDASAAKAEKVGKTGPSGPQINIGFALGGNKTDQKSLPVMTIETIDVEKDPSDE